MKILERILIVCAGLGMGNASRVVALMQALETQAQHDGRSLAIEVASWGWGFDFLASYQQQHPTRFQLHRLKSYTIASQPGLGLLAAPFIYLQNVRALRRITAALAPHLIVLDSDYHFAAYLGCAGRRVTIGQAHDVVARLNTGHYQISSWREILNFVLRERLDALSQRWFSSLVLVPSFTFTRQWPATGKVCPIPLMVRAEFLDTTASTPVDGSVGILLSGSSQERQPFLDCAARYGIRILEQVPSEARALNELDIVFTQGGLSSISECLALGKYLIVVPMSDHPEQQLNAREVERLGLGVSAQAAELKDLPTLLARARKTRAQQDPTRVDCTGANVAARLLLSRRRQPRRTRTTRLSEIQM
ncbi:MAG: glycosyltransferase [Bdellovibrionales bacterium]